MNANATLTLVLVVAALVSLLLLGTISKRADGSGAVGQIWVTYEQSTHHEDAGIGLSFKWVILWLTVICVAAAVLIIPPLAPSWTVN